MKKKRLMELINVQHYVICKRFLFKQKIKNNYLSKKIQFFEWKLGYIRIPKTHLF